MRKRIIAIILLTAIMVVGCGHDNVIDDKTLIKKEVKQEEVKVETEEAEKAEEISEMEDVIGDKVEESILEESVQTADLKKTEKKEAQKTEKKKETTAPTVTTPVVTTPETKECEHNWEKEKQYYDIFKKVTFGCNGCGLALFEWAEDKNSVEHIENLYFHEPCPTDRFPEPCYGGGYHNESVTIGFCGLCTLSADNPEGRVAYRQCMWTENGKRCSKNEVAGTYEKVEYNQNYFMYYDSCKCQKNAIIVNGNDDENSGRGIIYGKEKCTICGVYKDN